MSVSFLSLLTKKEEVLFDPGRPIDESVARANRAKTAASVSCCYNPVFMQWECKGLQFTVSIEPLGPFFLASARVPKEGMFVRVRPFSALGRTEEEAVAMLKDQIRFEYRRVPEVV